MKAIDWPTAKIDGIEYTFRLSYAAHAQLYKWGFSSGVDIPDAAWGAAMAGRFNAAGKWRSAGFATWLEVADALLPEELKEFGAAVVDAIKKAAPDATVNLGAPPA